MFGRLVFFLLALSACSARVYSDTAPSWVNSLRGGDSTLRLTSGDKVLFRSNFKSAKLSDREDVCDAAVKKNEEFIRKSYPRSAVIPMTVELRYFDPVVKDCSTTISVPRSFTDGAADTVKKTVGARGADTGVLNLTTAPDASADVFIDDVLFSQSDSNIKIAVKAGRHVLRVEHPNYQAFEKNVNVPAQGELPLSVLLTPASVNVSIDTRDGAAARVFLNGEARGTTPAAFSVNIDRDNTVTLKHPEFLEYSVVLKSRDMRRGDDVKLDAVMTEKSAYLSFTSDPAGAEVLIDGVKKGVTPLEKIKVSRGTHGFEVFKNGYAVQSGEIKAVGGQSVSKHARLKKSADAAFVLLETADGKEKTAAPVSRPAAEIVKRDKYHTFDFEPPAAESPLVPRAATREGILESLMKWDYPDAFLRAAVSYNEKGEFFVRAFFDKQAYKTAFFDRINGILKQVPKDSAVCKVEKKRVWTGKYDSNKYKIYKDVVQDNCRHAVSVAKSVKNADDVKKYAVSYLKKDFGVSAFAKRGLLLTVDYDNGERRILNVPVKIEKFKTGGDGVVFAAALHRDGKPACRTDAGTRRRFQAEMDRKIAAASKEAAAVKSEIDDRWFPSRDLKDRYVSLKNKVAALKKQRDDDPECKVGFLLEKDDFMLIRRRLRSNGVKKVALAIEKGDGK